MTNNWERAATLLAVTEVLPSEWRDLSYVLELVGDRELLNTTLEFDEASRSGQLLQYIRTSTEEARVDHWLALLERSTFPPQTRMVDVLASGYPTALLKCYDRPPFIFTTGDSAWTHLPSIAVVGSRRASAEGELVARRVATAAAESDIIVVSGLATGIDQAAHRGAKDARGITVGVIGKGIDLLCEASGGLVDHVVSQFRPGSPETTSSLPARNAVLSGLSDVSLLVEADEVSGTRSEADHALKQGRPVFLWEETLGSQHWAQSFASQAGVEFIDNIDELLARAQKERLNGSV